MVLFILSDWDEHRFDEVRFGKFDCNWWARSPRSPRTSSSRLRIVLWRHNLSHGHVLILLSTRVISSRSIF